MRVSASRNLSIVVFLDIFLLACSFYLAHLFRFDFSLPEWVKLKFWNMLPFVLVVKMICFFLFDLYRGMWRYTGLKDLTNVVKAAVCSTVVLILFFLFKDRFEQVSRSVFIVDLCLTILSISGLRILTRLCFEEFTENVSLKAVGKAFVKVFKRVKGRGKGVIIIGAGDCGQKICREFIENPYVQSHVIGFLDDDPGKIGRKIHGVTVLSAIGTLDQVVEAKEVDDVIIAIPNASATRMRQIVNLCRQCDVNFKTVPDMGELIDGKISINAIRDVEYRDLLGRKPVRLDKDRIGKYLGNRIVMVTGAGGSIGSGLCQQICRYSPQKILLFERAESPLYEIDLDLRKKFKGVEIVPILGDIQNKDELSRTFEYYRPDIVFHAAAYKHVPMLEDHPWKAVENNIAGTENLIEVSARCQCDRFVFVSTDKAVNPTNVMGASKRAAELLVQQKNNTEGVKTRFITVRFGNVIGSVGSVIPLFKKQIKEGGPVTVTHAEMSRYFMLIPEACQLILQAGAMGKGGEIFILDMGKPVKIDAIAKDLIRFSGFEPGVDIQIEYTGLRPGEKMYEELITDFEERVPTGHKKIMVLNSRNIETKRLNGELDQLKIEASNRNPERIRAGLKVIIPEYSPVYIDISGTGRHDMNCSDSKNI